MVKSVPPCKVVLVVGARPNFVKAAPVLKALRSKPDCFTSVLVHTGQHYNEEMSEAFFRDLGIEKPAHYLGVGSGTHAEQTARVMLAFERVLDEEAPAWVVVVGDVNSTLAAALTAVKKGISTAHVEAGLRSFDRTMPEELNRIVTDSLCDLLLTPSEDADRNLRREGIPDERIVRVGNVMIDSLVERLPEARALRAWEKEGLEEKGYVLVTLHRPSNVDNGEVLARIVEALCRVADDLPVLFPAHPRTAKQLQSIGRMKHLPSRFHLITPLGYVPFISVLSGARLVITDSGGVQEETSYLGVPCGTLRVNTERPVTVSRGTNVVMGEDPSQIVSFVRERLAKSLPKPCSIPMWDGRAADRIVQTLFENINTTAKRRA